MVLEKSESRCFVSVAAERGLMGVRLGNSCGLASSVDLEQGHGVYVKMGVRQDSLYGPANSADLEQEYAAVVAGTEKHFQQ